MAARVSTETLAVESLSRMPECELAEGAPDVRGWEVTTPTSVHVGVVKDLLVDLATMRVRYLDVELDPQPAARRRVLFPIGSVWINDALDQVVTTVLELDALPHYDRVSFDREFERDLLARLGHGDAGDDDFYVGPAFDDSQFRRGASGRTCGRREDDTESGACSPEGDSFATTESAANGVELLVVPES